MHLDIAAARRGGYLVLSPQGDVDFATAAQVKESITETLLAGELHVVVDLLGVEFIESTGLGALIGGRRRALALNGSLSLVCADERRKIFQVTGLDKVFTIFGTVEDATAQPPTPG